MLQKTIDFINNVRDVYINYNVNLSPWIKMNELRGEYIDIDTILPMAEMALYIKYTCDLEKNRQQQSVEQTLDFTAHHDFSVSNDQKRYGKHRVVEEIQQEIARRKVNQSSVSIASIGIGDGQTAARYCASLNLTGSDVLIGLDLHESYMASAKERLPGIKTRVVDLNLLSSTTTLPIDDNVIDIVECTMVGHHVENIELLFKEISRILKPQGMFYYADLIDKTQTVPMMVFEEDHCYPPFHGIEFYRQHNELFETLKKYLNVTLSRRLGPGYIILASEK
ncbi:class I SAM-dependent methyltransferase [Brenneria uluponensis]|uniref:class I SAM-dependent methyltransferase n=1 Tax=Brenneria uluponensis TaxID=3057057 RepID=UPI0028E4E6B9|nr:class I SAM-dependent methyltransferase [Brenneria ulupoensis]